MKTAIEVSDAEWEVMRVVWANTYSTSREMITILENKMHWKSSTIKTLIRRLVDKEALTATKKGRKFIYEAAITEEDTVNTFADELMERVCAKKHALVLEQLLENASLSKDNIDQLIEQLAKKRQTAPEDIQCQCVPGQCDCQLIEGK